MTTLTTAAATTKTATRLCVLCNAPFVAGEVRAIVRCGDCDRLHFACCLPRGKASGCPVAASRADGWDRNAPR